MRTLPYLVIKQGVMNRLNAKEIGRNYIESRRHLLNLFVLSGV